MKPQKLDNSPDLFRSQLSQTIDMGHRLMQLADQLMGKYRVTDRCFVSRQIRSSAIAYATFGGVALSESDV